MDTEFASVLLLADSAFPSGAFSHSFGLETAIDAGRVSDEGSLAAWLERYLLDGFATLEGAALVLAMRGDDALELDAVVSAATFASEVRGANARIARALLDALGATTIASPGLVAYAAAVNGPAHGRRAAGIASIVYGLAYGALGASERAAFCAVASSTLAALGGVAARAIPLGQRAIVRTLWSLRPTIERAYDRASRMRSAADLGSSAFTVEIDAMNHRLLDGRLFAS